MGKTYKKQSCKKEIGMQEVRIPYKKIYKRRTKYGNGDHTAE